MLDTAQPFKTALRRRRRAVWTGGALALAGWIGVLAVLERIGLPGAVIAPLVAIPAFIAVGASGLASRTMVLGEFDAAGRALPTGVNAFALAAAMAGIVLVAGQPTLTGLGAALGLAIAGLGLARPVREDGTATLAAWIGGENRLARIVAGLVVIACLAPGATALMAALAEGLAAHIGMEARSAVILAGALVAMAGLFGGWRGVSAAQLAAAIIGTGACLAAVGALVFDARSGASLPDAVPAFMRMGLGGAGRDLVAGLALGLAGGPAFFPYLAAAEDAAAARSTCLAAACLTGLFMLLAASGAFTLADGLSATMATLIRTGLLLCVLAAACAFAFAAANTLSHDLHRVFVAQRSPASRKLIAARLILLASVAAGAYAALHVSTPTPVLLRWSLLVSGAALLPAALSRAWLPGLPAAARMAAMLAGGGLVAVRPLMPPGQWPATLSFPAHALWGVALGLAILVFAALVQWGWRLSRARRAAPAPEPAGRARRSRARTRRSPK